MTSTTSGDLGSGVRVMPGDGGGIVVQSSDFDLGWRTRHAGRPGAAVMWEGSCFEVVEREPWRQGGRWVLAPWTGEDVMRVVLPMDAASVAAAAEKARETARADRLRPVLWMLSPILGFADDRWQRRWNDELGFPAVPATWFSAILESVFGAACLLEIAVAVGAGESLFPWIPRPLVFLGPYLFVEGLYRVVRVSSGSEPVGSLFGLVATVFEGRRQAVVEPIQAPEVQSFDQHTGTLALLSGIHRRDWERPGLLPYRGEFFALDSTERQGESWIYVFGRLDVAEGWDGPRLRLVPSRTKPDVRSFADQPGPVKTALLTIAVTLARRRFQERWARQLGIDAKWFTVMGAAAELIGGLGNLARLDGGSGLAVVLNLYFVAEAVFRIGSVVLSGQPCGSVFGLALGPALERSLPETPSTTGE